jgi:hypothetical protein
MMKAQKTCLLVFAVAVCLAAGSMLFATAANAELKSIESGGVLLTFDDANLWWQQVLSRHSGNFGDATISVGLDNDNQYGLINTWEIASQAQIENLFENFDSSCDVYGGCLPPQDTKYFEETLELFHPDDPEVLLFRIWHGWSSTTDGTDSNIIGYLAQWQGNMTSDFWFEEIMVVDRQDVVSGSWVVSAVGPPEDCTGNDDCDDELYCNGEETCVDGKCEDGTAPCESEFCDEETDSCELPCSCDLNNDGVCNSLDWEEFIQDWDRTDCPIQ